MPSQDVAPFRRRFGMVPTTWRLLTHGRLVSALAILLSLCLLYRYVGYIDLSGWQRTSALSQAIGVPATHFIGELRGPQKHNAHPPCKIAQFPHSHKMLPSTELASKMSCLLLGHSQPTEFSYLAIPFATDASLEKLFRFHGNNNNFTASRFSPSRWKSGGLDKGKIHALSTTSLQESFNELMKHPNIYCYEDHEYVLSDCWKLFYDGATAQSTALDKYAQIRAARNQIRAVYTSPTRNAASNASLNAVIYGMKDKKEAACSGSGDGSGGDGGFDKFVIASARYFVEQHYKLSSSSAAGHSGSTSSSSKNLTIWLDGDAGDSHLVLALQSLFSEGGRGVMIRKAFESSSNKRGTGSSSKVSFVDRFDRLATADALSLWLGSASCPSSKQTMPVDDDDLAIAAMYTNTGAGTIILPYRNYSSHPHATLISALSLSPDTVVVQLDPIQGQVVVVSTTLPQQPTVSPTQPPQQQQQQQQQGIKKIATYRKQKATTPSKPSPPAPPAAEPPKPATIITQHLATTHDVHTQIHAKVSCLILSHIHPMDYQYVHTPVALANGLLTYITQQYESGDNHKKKYDISVTRSHSFDANIYNNYYSKILPGVLQSNVDRIELQKRLTVVNESVFENEAKKNRALNPIFEEISRLYRYGNEEFDVEQHLNLGKDVALSKLATTTTPPSQLFSPRTPSSDLSTLVDRLRSAGNISDDSHEYVLDDCWGLLLDPNLVAAPTAAKLDSQAVQQKKRQVVEQIDNKLFKLKELYSLTPKPTAAENNGKGINVIVYFEAGEVEKYFKKKNKINKAPAAAAAGGGGGQGTATGSVSPSASTSTSSSSSTVATEGAATNEEGMKISRTADGTTVISFGDDKSGDAGTSAVEPPKVEQSSSSGPAAETKGEEGLTIQHNAEGETVISFGRRALSDSASTSEVDNVELEVFVEFAIRYFVDKYTYDYHMLTVWVDVQSLTSQQLARIKRKFGGLIRVIDLTELRTRSDSTSAASSSSSSSIDIDQVIKAIHTLVSADGVITTPTPFTFASALFNASQTLIVPQQSTTGASSSSADDRGEAYSGYIRDYFALSNRVVRLDAQSIVAKLLKSAGITQHEANSADSLQTETLGWSSGELVDLINNDNSKQSKCTMTQTGSDGFGHQLEGKLSCMILAELWPSRYKYAHYPFQSFEHINQTAREMEEFVNLNGHSSESVYPVTKINKGDKPMSWHKLERFCKAMRATHSRPVEQYCRNGVVNVVDNCWDLLYTEPVIHRFANYDNTDLRRRYFSTPKPKTGFDDDDTDEDSNKNQERNDVSAKSLQTMQHQQLRGPGTQERPNSKFRRNVIVHMRHGDSGDRFQLNETSYFEAGIEYYLDRFQRQRNESVRFWLETDSVDWEPYLTLLQRYSSITRPVNPKDSFVTVFHRMVCADGIVMSPSSLSHSAVMLSSAENFVISDCFHGIHSQWMHSDRFVTLVV